ncbi:hypothetical protein FSARC_11851 [Fusarium sarcochroum]|uniref:Protein kinase domain-containing protein n=1 Tax=Fusarium sarcochroum TaxID=1208366 RepID=A0A8H4TCK5_9HYPO|nr:hypothetical protein FSARC_11851 [Fusarium sarcochroum]
MPSTLKTRAMMDETLSDVVRDYRLTTQYDENSTIHFHDDPDAPPFSPRRLERWKTVRTLGYGGQRQVDLEVCIDGGRYHTERAVKKIRLQGDKSKRRYEHELAAIVKFSHDKNILVNKCPQGVPAGPWWVKLADFGISKRSSTDTNITTLSNGTPSYMAPELLPPNPVNGSANHSRTADIWALGITVFFILTGTVPFQNPYMTIEYARNLGEPFPGSSLDRCGPETRLDSNRAMRDAWIQTQLPGMSISGMGSRPSTISSRRSSVDDTKGLTTEISTLASKSYSRRWTGEILGTVKAQNLRDWGQDDTGRVTLNDAVSNGVTETHSQLSTEPRIGGENRVPWKLLSTAIRTGNTELVKVLLDNNVSASMSTYDGWTPLHLAALLGRIEIIRLLHANGANLEAGNPDGHTPLRIATREGNESAVGLLLELGANIEARDHDGVTPLREAVWRGHVAVAKLLAGMGANVDTEDSSHYTPLQRAAKEGLEIATKLLLEMGANIEQHDYKNQSLILAAEGGHDAVTKLLIEKGANIEAKGRGNDTALITAATTGYKTVTKLLLEKGANTEAHDVLGSTSLLCASRWGSEAMVELLLDKGAELETMDDNGQTPLMEAAKMGNEAVVKLLLDRGAKTEGAGESGRTPLLHASDEGQKHVVKLLLEKGADIEAADVRGKTSLILATQKKHKAVVELLLQEGAQKGLSYQLARLRF